MVDNTIIMSYTVQQLATLAGVSARTLHYYDEVGLLQPAGIRRNGYRYYEEKELLLLQQILFFRELDFSIDEIKRILSSPSFDMTRALQHHRRLIELKKNRLNRLLKTIDTTINTIHHTTHMDEKQLYNNFNQDEINQYAAEAKERWGHTDAYRQSQERTKNWTKEDYARIKHDADTWMKHFATHMKHKPDSDVVQELIDQHYNALRTFYEPNLELYRGLAEMYISDERFTSYYERYAVGLAQFMHDAMIAYCDNHET